MYEHISIFHRQSEQVLLKNFKNNHFFFFNYLKKNCLKIQQDLPKYFMVGFVLYQSKSVFRYR